MKMNALRFPVFLAGLIALPAMAARFREYDVPEELCRMRVELAAVRGGRCPKKSNTVFPDRVPLSHDVANDHEVLRVKTVVLRGAWKDGTLGVDGLRDSTLVFTLPDRPCEATASEIWFGNVDDEIEVFLNGSPLARCDKDVIDFRVDATAEIRWNSKNELRVRHRCGKWMPWTVEALKCGK